MIYAFVLWKNLQTDMPVSSDWNISKHILFWEGVSLDWETQFLVHMLDCAQMRQPKVLQHELYLCCKAGTMFTHIVLMVSNQLCFAFVDLEKIFDWVLRDVIWWALRKLGVQEGLVTVVQAILYVWKCQEVSCQVQCIVCKLSCYFCWDHGGTTLRELIFGGTYFCGPCLF